MHDSQFLPVFRMYKVMPLQELFMLERTPTKHTQEGPPIIVVSLVMIKQRTLVQELPVAELARIQFFILIRLLKKRQELLKRN